MYESSTDDDESGISTTSSTTSNADCRYAASGVRRQGIAKAARHRDKPQPGQQNRGPPWLVELSGGSTGRPGSLSEEQAMANWAILQDELAAKHGNNLEQLEVRDTRAARLIRPIANS